MPFVIIESKPIALTDLLKVTSQTLEEKEFLIKLYDRRLLPSALRANPDGSVTVEWME